MRAAALRCRIRLMQADDIPQVMDIERQSFPTMWPQTVYRRELKNKMARYLVASEPIDAADSLQPPADATAGRGIGGLVRRFFGGRPATPPNDRILGMVGLWCIVGEGHIVTIAVGEEHRRRGIGEVLLVAALEAARDAGQEVVTLEYRISNDGARALYDKYAFSQVGVRVKYYSDNQEDAVLMTTPSLHSSTYRQLMAQRIIDLRDRWGDGYPLEGPASWQSDSSTSG